MKRERFFFFVLLIVALSKGYFAQDPPAQAPPAKEIPAQNLNAAVLGANVIDVKEANQRGLNSPQKSGAIIVGLDAEGPLAIGGFSQFDLITKIDDFPIKGKSDFERIENRLTAGAEATLRGFRMQPNGKWKNGSAKVKVKSLKQLIDDSLVSETDKFVNQTAWVPKAVGTLRNSLSSFAFITSAEDTHELYWLFGTKTSFFGLEKIDVKLVVDSQRKQLKPAAHEKPKFDVLKAHENWIACKIEAEDKITLQEVTNSQETKVRFNDNPDFDLQISDVEKRLIKLILLKLVSLEPKKDIKAAAK